MNLNESLINECCLLFVIDATTLKMTNAPKKYKRRPMDSNSDKRPQSDDSELDEEDYNLIQENTGLSLQQDRHKFKRLKRKSAAADESENLDDDAAAAEKTAPSSRPNNLENIFDDDDQEEDEDQNGDGMEIDANQQRKRSMTYNADAEERFLHQDDLEDFIVEDEEDENGGEGSKSKRQQARSVVRTALAAGAAHGFDIAKQLGFSQEAWNLVFDLFGDGSDYAYALNVDTNAAYDYDEDEMDGVEYSSNNRPNKDKRIEDVYEPAEVEEKMFTEYDVKVRQDDIPERLQTRGTPVTEATDDEFYQESVWVALNMSRFQKEKASLFEDQSVFKVIEKVLRFLRTFKLEALFVIRHRKDYYSGQLTDADIWEVYDLDEKWCHLNQRKQALLKYSSAISELELLVKNANDEDAVRDVSEYLQIRYSKVLDEFRTGDSNQAPVNGKKVFKRPVKRDVYLLAKESKLDSFAFIFSISPEQLAANLRENYKKNFVDDPEREPEMMAVEYICAEFTKPDEVLKITEIMMAKDLASSVALREAMRTFLFSASTITVTPTEKGKVDIDEMHPYATFKYLTKKPVRLFDDHQFLLLNKASDDGLLEYAIDVDERSKDHIFNMYLSDANGEMAEVWNQHRRKILGMALEEHIIPAVKRNIVEKLTDIAQRHIIKDCKANFENQLKIAPYKGDSDDNGKRGRVFALSCGGGELSTAAFGVLLSDTGDVVDFIKLGQIHSRNRDVKQTEMSKLETFLRKITEKADPPVFVVAGWSVEAKQLHDDVANLLEGIFYNKYTLLWGRDNIARIYRNSKKSSEDFPNYPPLLKYCIALGRTLQEPLIQFATLFDKERSILYLEHHQNQDLVASELLYKGLEQSFISHVNDVGIDINDCMATPIQHSLLPFICGLGFRKARQLVLDISAQGGVVDNRQDLVTKCKMGSIVFVNCASFLRVTEVSRSSRKKQNAKLDILDSTRIHPEDYDLARKMAADALELEENADEDDPSIHVEDLMDDPEKLDELDLGDYAVELERKTGKPKKLTLEMIKQELKSPYADHREQFSPPNVDELFCMLTGETDKSLYSGLIVAAVVQNVRESHVQVRLDCGVEGMINLRNLTDEDRVIHCADVVKEGQSLKCKVLMINKERMFVELGSKDSIIYGRTALPQFARAPKDQFYNFDLERIDMAILAQQAAGKPVTSGIKLTTKYSQHPLFALLNHRQAERQLAPMPIGSMVFRPSSHGDDYLALTWKVQDEQFQHVEIKGEPGNRLRIENDVYSNLDEISVRYVNEMLRFISEILKSPKYKAGSREELYSVVEREIMANPKRIPYLFGNAPKAPCKFILVFKLAPNQQTVQESITVTPHGFRFRASHFQNLTMLLKAFKVSPLAQKTSSQPQMMPPPVGGMPMHPAPAQYGYGPSAFQQRPAPSAFGQQTYDRR